MFYKKMKKYELIQGGKKYILSSKIFEDKNENKKKKKKYKKNGDVNNKNNNEKELNK